MRSTAVSITVFVTFAVFGASSARAQCGQLQKLTAFDGGPGDFFGFSVAMTGDSIAVGARNHPAPPFFPWTCTTSNCRAGAVYTYVRSGTAWVLDAKLTAPPGDDNVDDGFGHSVSYDRGLLAVGAVGDDGAVANSNIGAVYVFLKGPTSWSLEAQLAPQPGSSVSSFGRTVALWDDTLVIGAENAGPPAGTAFVYRRTGTTWNLEAQLVSSNPEANDFGMDVALFQNTALIGTPRGKVAGVLTGTAYVFRRTGSTWQQVQEIVNPGSNAGVHFGESVALYGRTAAVGAPLEPSGSLSLVGIVYTYAQDSAGQYMLTQLLTPPIVVANEEFGNDLAQGSAITLVPAWRFTGTFPGEGAAWQFNVIAGLWTSVVFHPNPAPGAGEEFGRSVAIGNYAVIGTPRDDSVVVPGDGPGSAYVYSLCP